MGERASTPFCLPWFTAAYIIGALEFALGHSIGFQLIGEWSFSLATPGIAKTFLFNREWLRAYATFPHPNIFGGIMAVMALVWLNWAIELRLNKDKQRFSVALAMVFVFVVGVLLSFSRAAMIALASGTLFLWPLLVKLQRSKELSRWGWGVGIVCAGVFCVMLVSRAVALFGWDYLSILRRQGLNHIAFQMWWDSPLLGVGLSQFIIHADNYWKSLGFNRFIQPVHNIYLLILVETGIAGTISFFGATLWTLWRSWRQLPLYIKLMWWVIATTGLVDHYWWTIQAGLLMLFLTWGLTLSTIKGATTHRE